MLVRRDGEEFYAFARRKTCNKECRRRHMTKTDIVLGRHCLICNEPIEQRQDEGLRSFAVRKTCGGKCGEQFRAAMAQTKTVVFERACPVCGEPLVQRADEHPAQFMRRKTCKKECAVTLRTGPNAADRSCSACGDSLRQRRGEQPSTFMRRQTCGDKCSAALHTSRVDFYGVLLPASQVAEILGVSREAIRKGGSVLAAAKALTPAQRKARSQNRGHELVAYQRSARFRKAHKERT